MSINYYPYEPNLFVNFIVYQCKILKQSLINIIIIS